MTDYQDPKTIWLQPWCDTCDLHVYEGRQWCEDGSVFDKCEGEGCGKMPVKYILAPNQPKEDFQMKSRPDLDALIKKSVANFNAMSPEAQRAHRQAQRRSWVIGEMMMDRPDSER